ncbi:hypothetical protein MMC34_002025 [Xylographa carneopallida]|nr:hypothetical protein [Xylographa carneopallida]
MTVITLLIIVGIVIIELDVLDIVGIDIMVDIEDVLLEDIDDSMLDIVIDTTGGGGASDVPSVLEPEPCTGNSPGVD